ncbi:MAG: hypothetical protein AB1696_29165 [Planctomycetota bacterium]
MTENRRPPWPASWPPFWRTALHVAIATGVGNVALAGAFVVIVEVVLNRPGSIYVQQKLLMVGMVVIPLVLSALVCGIVARARWRTVISLVIAFFMGFVVFVPTFLRGGIYIFYIGYFPNIIAMVIKALMSCSPFFQMPLGDYRPSLAALITLTGTMAAVGLVCKIWTLFGRRMLVVAEIVLWFIAMTILVTLACDPGHAYIPGISSGYAWSIMCPTVVTLYFAITVWLFARISGGGRPWPLGIACIVGTLMFSASVFWARATGLRELLLDAISPIANFPDIVRSFVWCISVGVLFPATYAITARILISAVEGAKDK